MRQICVEILSEKKEVNNKLVFIHCVRVVLMVLPKIMFFFFVFRKMLSFQFPFQQVLALKNWFTNSKNTTKIRISAKTFKIDYSTCISGVLAFLEYFAAFYL